MNVNWPPVDVPLPSNWANSQAPMSRLTQQPATGSKTMDLTVVRGHSGLELLAALGKAPLSSIQGPHHGPPGWHHWLGVWVLWGLSKQPQYSDFPGSDVDPEAS